MPYKQPISVLVVIHTPDLHILLLERVDYPGHWQSVTGSREKDESLAATACREVQEETGLLVDQNALRDWHYSSDFEIYPRWRQRYAPGVTMNTEHVFSVQLPEICAIQCAEREHLSYRWVAHEQAAQMVFSPSNAEAILRLPSMLAM